MADIEPPTKRICLVAFQGSVANNPFRRLTPDVLASIKMLTKTWVPTPSAQAIKEANLEFIYETQSCFWNGAKTTKTILSRQCAFRKPSFEDRPPSAIQSSTRFEVAMEPYMRRPSRNALFGTWDLTRP